MDNKTKKNIKAHMWMSVAYLFQVFLSVMGIAIYSLKGEPKFVLFWIVNGALNLILAIRNDRNMMECLDLIFKGQQEELQRYIEENKNGGVDNEE